MSITERALVLGAGGFIGGHLVKRLKREGLWVRGADRKRPEFSTTAADEFLTVDLRDEQALRSCFVGGFDQVYQLAAEMGGAGYLFTGEHDFSIFFNSASINLNTAKLCAAGEADCLFFASSACVYNQDLQRGDSNFFCKEADVYPANPDSDYGWEKLFAERLFSAQARQTGLRVRIGRLHNVYGPEGTWRGGREKVPAAVCRKVAEAEEGDAVELWGDGAQVRSFLFIEDCIDGILRLTRSEMSEPLNLGSDEAIRIGDLARMVIDISGKRLSIRYSPGPIGVRARSSDNALAVERLGWKPATPLRDGMAETYAWIAEQVMAQTKAHGRHLPKQVSPSLVK